MDGLCSNITYMYVTVDTVAPQISFNNEFETYEEGIYLHGICSKDTIEVWLDGEYVYMSDVPDFGIYFELAPGEHKWYSSSMIGVETKQPKKLCFKGT